MEKHHLPDNREPLQKVQTIPPGTILKKADIRTTLLNPSLSKQSNPLELKQGTLETIDSFLMCQYMSILTGLLSRQQ